MSVLPRDSDYVGLRPIAKVAGSTVIVDDDGIALGPTMRAWPLASYIKISAKRRTLRYARMPMHMWDHTDVPGFFVLPL
jgi:hypothetical protein